MRAKNGEALFQAPGVVLTAASLGAMAEGRGLRTVFTIDRTDFAIYRIKRGHRYATFHMIG